MINCNLKKSDLYFILKRSIINTADGSTTIFIEDWNEHYHSKHGAINEAYHVFIKNGLSLFKNQSLSILEMGFGTGLNAFITLLESRKLNCSVDYFGIDAYPISNEEQKQLNYAEQLSSNKGSTLLFEKMHSLDWGQKNNISENFSLIKKVAFFNEITIENEFNLIYFDAFGARVQPELWTETIFEKMYTALKTKGVLVTYSAKGSVRRAMQAVGFTVERLPGPPGKREMLRATKH